MGLDIRIPIGLLFSILSLVLIVYGLIGDKMIYARSLGYNVNILWGCVMLIFGVAMLILGRRGSSTVRSTTSSPEGLAIERDAHRRGLEEEVK
jgi:hypothetical protein